MPTERLQMRHLDDAQLGAAPPAIHWGSAPDARLGLSASPAPSQSDPVPPLWEEYRAGALDNRNRMKRPMTSERCLEPSRVRFKDWHANARFVNPRAMLTSSIHSGNLGQESFLCRNGDCTITSSAEPVIVQSRLRLRAGLVQVSDVQTQLSCSIDEPAFPSRPTSPEPRRAT